MSLTIRNRQAFSGGHHDDHGHHDYSVHLDKNKTWIRYKSSPALAIIEGLEETNYTLQPLEDSDPYQHLRNAPLFSFNRMYYNDPWFHDDSHEPYNSAPNRGYVNGQDPTESRYILTFPWISCLGVTVFVTLILSYRDDEIGYGEAEIYRSKLARDYVCVQLEKKNQELNRLKQKQAELLARSAN